MSEIISASNVFFPSVIKMDIKSLFKGYDNCCLCSESWKDKKPLLFGATDAECVFIGRFDNNRKSSVNERILIECAEALGFGMYSCMNFLGCYVDQAESRVANCFNWKVKALAQCVNARVVVLFGKEVYCQFFRNYVFRFKDFERNIYKVKLFDRDIYVLPVPSPIYLKGDKERKKSVIEFLYEAGKVLEKELKGGKVIV